MNELYTLLKTFKKKYPLTIAWRLKSNARVITKHLNPNEKVKYAFVAQKNNSIFSLFSTCVVALTNQRLLVGYKRVVFGYYFSSITPDLYNDLEVRHGIIWGRVTIDTVGETVYLSNIDPNALPEIETNITKFMMREKKKYLQKKPDQCNLTKTES